MEDLNNLMETETQIVNVLKNIFDPEIPVNIYDLGLIYDINIDDDNNVKITMTLTAPNCPAADYILQDVHDNVKSIENIEQVEVNLTFEPPWDQSMLTEEAKLELGML